MNTCFKATTFTVPYPRYMVWMPIKLPALSLYDLVGERGGRHVNSTWTQLYVVCRGAGGRIKIFPYPLNK